MAVIRGVPSQDPYGLRDGVIWDKSMAGEERRRRKRRRRWGGGEDGKEKGEKG
jgi:hypothetical protein